MIHYAVDAEWSVVVRRILETMANSFSVSAFAVHPDGCLGAPDLYKWMVIPAGVDPSLDDKRACSIPTSWAVFTVIYLQLSSSARRFILRWLSTRQD